EGSGGGAGATGSAASSTATVAGDDVGRAHDHLADATAVLVHVVFAVGELAVDVDGSAAGDGLEGVRSAAGGVQTLVVEPAGRHPVDDHVGRARHQRADARVRAGWATVCVCVDLGEVTKSCLWRHRGPPR